MHWVNWLIVIVYLVWVVVDGIKKSQDTDTVSGYFMANKSLSWWVVGLSVMATQLSAVTMIGTPGQGATDGLRFIQLYLGLPLAMVILGVTIVPLLHGSGVYTAYEYLERRFDAKTGEHQYRYPRATVAQGRSENPARVASNWDSGRETSPRCF